MPRISIMPYNAADAIAFCQRQSGRYDDGECWTLVENAVVGAGGRSSRGLTPRFSRTSSYVWGTAVAAGSLQAGDVLQFSGYSWTRTTVTDVTNADGSGSTDEAFETQTRGSPQHSALVVRVISTGVVEVIEQNVPRNTGPVQTVTLVLIPPATPSVTTTRTGATGAQTVTTVTVTDVVSGTPRCYRPIAA
jgi:hypothetical protein